MLVLGRGTQMAIGRSPARDCVDCIERVGIRVVLHSVLSAKSFISQAVWRLVTAFIYRDGVFIR